MIHITCNMSARDLPDVYALIPWASWLQAYILRKPMLQLLLKIGISECLWLCVEVGFYLNQSHTVLLLWLL